MSTVTALVLLLALPETEVVFSQKQFIQFLFVTYVDNQHDASFFVSTKASVHLFCCWYQQYIPLFLTMQVYHESYNNEFSNLLYIPLKHPDNTTQVGPT